MLETRGLGRTAGDSTPIKTLHYSDPYKWELLVRESLWYSSYWQASINLRVSIRTVKAWAKEIGFVRKPMAYQKMHRAEFLAPRPMPPPPLTLARADRRPKARGEPSNFVDGLGRRMCRRNALILVVKVREWRACWPGQPLPAWYRRLLRDIRETVKPRRSTR